MRLPIPLAEAVARTEQVAQEQWELADVEGDRREVFLNAVRVAYVKGIEAAIVAIGGGLQAHLKANPKLARRFKSLNLGR